MDARTASISGSSRPEQKRCGIIWPPRFHRSSLATVRLPTACVFLLRAKPNRTMEVTLIHLAATKRHRLAATIAAAALICAALLVWPHAKTQAIVAQPFMPIFATSVTLTGALTAFLLWTQYRASRRFVFAVLASAYSFTSITAAIHLLVFPGAFLPTGLFGAGRQTAIWIWLLWHGAFPLLVTLALAARSKPPIDNRYARRCGVVTVAASIALSVGLSWAAIAARDLLPNLVSSTASYRHLTPGPALLTVETICAAALLTQVAVTRLKTSMDLWLAVALLAELIDVTLTLGAGARYSFGWYAARMASMVSASALLGVLMYETSGLYRKLTDAHRALKESSVRDGLTGVLNRAYFEEHYRREFVLATASHDPLSVLLIDVDHFKAYNDAYGHLAGDQCLRRVAQTLTAQMRHEAGFIARYGGEEFMVVLPMCAPQTGLAIAERLRRSIADLQLPAPSESSSYVTVSIGHASSRSLSDASAETLLANTDAALYEAKALGRNRVQDEKHGQAVFRPGSRRSAGTHEAIRLRVES